MEASLSVPRPGSSVRKDTDSILSYYQSEEAGQSHTPPPEPETSAIATSKRATRPRQMSTASSPSEYSPDNSDAEANPKPNVLRRKSKKLSDSVRKRPSVPSVGGANRRRLVIVDTGTGTDDQGQQSGRKDSLKSRRGMDSPMEGLALIAPADAPPKTYTHLTPPTTAPLASETTYSEASDQVPHPRSTSEASTEARTLHQRKSSRQVTILGTTPASASASLDPSQSQPETFKPPIFQRPQSRSPSPVKKSQSDTSDYVHRGRDDFSSGMNPTSPQQLVVTPDIGEEKNIHDPVAAPVIVSLTPSSPPYRSRPETSIKIVSSPIHSADSIYSPSSAYPPTPFSPQAPDSYLYYQPGVHATAGPLPPPPRAIFDINPGTPPPPRPPRLGSPPLGGKGRGDVTPSTQPLRMLEPGSGVLRSKLSAGSLYDGRSNSPSSMLSDQSGVSSSKASRKSAGSEKLPPIPSAHVREGAFASSTESEASLLIDTPQAKGTMVDLVADVDHAIDTIRLVKSSDVPPPTVVEPLRASEASEADSPPDFTRDESWVSEFPDDIPTVITPASDDTGLSGESGRGFFRRSLSLSPPKISREIVDDVSPSSTPRHIRSTLATSLKRFSSLPRRPDSKRFSTGSHSSNASSLSTLPPPPEVSPRSPPPMQKIISPWPSAMFYGEVIAKKSALERSLGYAAKINELYIHDCGLGDFLMDTQHRDQAGGNSGAKRATLGSSGPRGPSSASKSFQPRHISRSSMASEATFPRRADTSTATDLTVRKAVDTSPPRGPPPLPYPSLAPSTLSSRVSTNSSSSSVITPLSPSSIKSPSGFFSSLGRKASMKSGVPRGNTLIPQQPPAKLQKSPTKAPPNPRPVQIPSTPTVPGGPRAVPNRVARSQTMLPKSPSSTAPSGHNRSSSMTRRASLFGGRQRSPGSGSDSAGSIEEDPEFVAQVDSLADLLPQAQRAVLAGYLRRAGSDLNAIGQYLEDEKNGTLRTD